MTRKKRELQNLDIIRLRKEVTDLRHFIQKELQQLQLVPDYLNIILQRLPVEERQDKRLVANRKTRMYPIWTRDEIAYIISQYHITPHNTPTERKKLLQHLATHINRTPDAIRVKLGTYGLRLSNR